MADKERPTVSTRHGFDTWLVEHMSIRHLPGARPGSDADPAGRGWRDFAQQVVEWTLMGAASVGLILLALFLLTRT
jgi:hypothetical protein